MKQTKSVCKVFRCGRAAVALTMLSIVANAYPAALTAQAAKPPMAGMAKMDSSSRDPDMKNTMDGPQPLGIMIGRSGAWMVAYQYMVEHAQGILDGTGAVSQASVLARFATTPTAMTMQTHMAMIMYAPTDRLAVMAVLPYVQMSMGELHRDATRSTERSEGIGDLELRGLYSMLATKGARHRILASLGIGVPTGSVNALDGEGLRLEYPMQLGSGTFAILPGIVYLGQASPWAWGVEVRSTVRLGMNEHGYKPGDRYESSIWIVRRLTGWASLSTGAGSEYWENVRGADSLLDATDEPTKDPNIQGGKRINVQLGITVHPPNGFFKGQQFLVQGDVPVMQSLDGPQLKRTCMLHVAWQWGL